jgi:hypothetical protein
VVVNLGEPLLANVLKRGGGCDAKADEEDIGLGVRERAQSVVILLTGGIKQSESVGLVADPVVRDEIISYPDSYISQQRPATFAIAHDGACAFLLSFPILHSPLSVTGGRTGGGRKKTPPLECRGQIAKVLSA